MNQPAYVTCPGLRHFTLAISCRPLPCTYSSWSLEFGMAVPVAQDSLFTLFSLSLCLQKKNQCPQGTYSQSCSAERSPLPGVSSLASSCSPRAWLGAPHTPPHLTLPTLWYNFGVHFLRPPDHEVCAPLHSCHPSH